MPYVNGKGEIIAYTEAQLLQYRVNLRFEELEKRIKKLENGSKSKKKQKEL